MEKKIEMDETEIRNAILSRLYEANFSGEGSGNLPQLRDERGWERSTFSRTVDRMIHDGIIKRWTMGGNYQVTALGVVTAEEEEGIIPDELLEKNQQIRTVVLDSLARSYEERGIGDSHVSLETLQEGSGAEQQILVPNLLLLKDLDYVDIPFKGHFGITYKGIDAVDKWRQQKGIAERFEAVERMKPHPRGRAFQKLLAEVVEQHGWSQEEGLRTSHEEMDVVISQGREYYLIECKWESAPIQSGVIREVYGKLSNRAGVQGIVASMSGFTAGTVEQVAEYKNKRVIILFGPNDVRSVIRGEAAFDQLLTDKHRALVIRGEVICE